MKRSPEQLRNHFDVERELAVRLRESSREERTELFGRLYDELFERVPDHPRLTRRETPEASRAGVEGQMRLLSPHLEGRGRFLEFAPGDCRLSYEVAKRVGEVVAVDISDQRAERETAPENFKLVVYDGYEIDLQPHSFDVAFSYQFLEHLHPDDVPLHLAMIARLLKPGGVYVFDTPHRYSGPHDVSRFFGDELVCFHFQEWTYRGMREILCAYGFANLHAFRRGRLLRSSFSNRVLDLVEWGTGMLPRKLRKALSRRLFQSVSMACESTGTVPEAIAKPGLRKRLGRLRRKILPGKLVRPSLFVIGAQKAGTTALAYYLGQHPQVLRGSEKEVDYFGSDTRYPLGEAFYDSHFRFLRVPSGAITFDASPHYLGDAAVARRIFEYDPECKIICLFREPAARAFSAFNMYRRFIEADPCRFDKLNPRWFSPEVIDGFRRRPLGHAKDFTLAVSEEVRSYFEGFRYEWRLLDYGLYAERIKPSLDVIPEGQLLLMDSAELRRDTTAAMAKISGFLGLREFDWAGADLGQHHTESYREKMPGRAADLLREFYAEPNRKFYELTGIGSEW